MEKSVLFSNLTNISNTLSSVKSKTDTAIGVAVTSKPYSGYAVSADSYVEKNDVGNVDIYASIDGNTIQNQWIDIGFIPAGFFPSTYKAVASFVSLVDGTLEPIRCYVYPDGVIKVFNHLTTSAYTVVIMGSYSVK